MGVDLAVNELLAWCAIGGSILVLGLALWAYYWPR